MYNDYWNASYQWLDADHYRAFILFAAILLFLLAIDLTHRVKKMVKEQAQGQKAVVGLLNQLEDLRKGRTMTRKERQRYLRSEIPDIIVDAFEAAHERGRLTKTEVNEHYRKLAALYKMPDFKTQKLMGVEPIVIPTRANRPGQTHFDRVKAGISARVTGPLRKLLYGKPAPIPGPPIGAPNGDPPKIRKRGQLFAKVRK